MIILEDRPIEADMDGAAREAQRADGTWPVLRPDMAATGPIIGRMAQDCLAAFDEFGVVDEQSLVRLGWRREVVRRHEDKARETLIRLLAERARRARAAASRLTGTAA